MYTQAIKPNLINKITFFEYLNIFMYVQKTLLSVVAVVFFHCQHNSKQQQHKSHTNLKQAIQIMHACMCINQYMLDISGVLQCIANAFHMHMHMFLKNLETQNHTISRLPKSNIFEKIGNVCKIS